MGDLLGSPRVAPLFFFLFLFDFCIFSCYRFSGSDYAINHAVDLGMSFDLICRAQKTDTRAQSYAHITEHGSKVTLLLLFLFRLGLPIGD